MNSELSQKESQEEGQLKEDKKREQSRNQADDREIESLSIYLHWPFCLSKCPYCDFMSIPCEFDERLFRRYGALLLEDLKKSLLFEGFRRDENPREYKEPTKTKESAKYSSSCISEYSQAAEHTERIKIKSVFLGGGTPSLMCPEDIANIVNFLQEFSVENIPEISLEANPATFDERKMREIKAAGVNRLSLGIQSFSDDNLRFLGRIYDAKQAMQSAEIVAKVFDNFSFDFMYGYQGQTLSLLKEDLQKAVDFGCKHLSCYQLTFEEKTPFYNKLQEGIIKSVGEDVETNLYQFIGDFLEKNGLKRYEISNYAQENFECQHNLVYWNYRDYLGVGPAAHGRMSRRKPKKAGVSRFATEKIRNPREWAKALEEGGETYSVFNELNEEEILEELLIMRLRLVSKPLSMQDLYNTVSGKVVDRFITKDKLDFIRKNELIKDNGDDDSIELSSNGILRLNSVIEFLMVG